MAQEVLKWMAGIIGSIIVGVTVFYITQGVLMVDRDAAPTPTPIPTETPVSSPTPTIVPAITPFLTQTPSPTAPGTGPPVTPAPGNTQMPTNGTIVVRARASPITIPPGSSTVVTVTALTGQNVPIENATIRVTADDGRFIPANNTTIEGRTNSSGMFQATWEAPNPTIPVIAYELIVNASSPGYTPAEESVTVVISGG
jgi:hypothetical protein